MELVSCGKNIQLHSFPKLNTISTYGQIQTHGSYDFQFFRKSKFFIASNPQKPAVEYFSLKSQGEISPLTKIRTENLCCIACPKNNLEYVALGLSTGHMRLINYKTKEIAYRFSPQTINNSIISLDFSATDDYLASTSETGNIKLYGMKSFIEVDSFNIDKNSTVIKFHPTKRFQLAVASYLGKVSIYDAQVKKKIFHLDRAHTSPCRDVAVSSVNDACLFSVGFDCYINIYDTRKKSIAQQLKTDHPLSAIALSATSPECVVGNLKGELLMFDIRRMSEAFTKVQAHESLVTRLAFVPPEGTEIDFQATSPSCESKNESVSAVDSVGSLNESVDVFSLMPILEKNRASNESVTVRRDSFMDFLNAHMSSVENSRLSIDSGDDREKRRSKSRSSMSPGDQTFSREKNGSLDLSFVTIRKKRTSGQAEPKLSDIKEIEEQEKKDRKEDEVIEILQENLVIDNNDNGNFEAMDRNSVEKEAIVEENLMVNQNDDGQIKSPHSFSQILPGYRNSTPNRMPENAVFVSAVVEGVTQEMTKQLNITENKLKYEMNTLKWHTYEEMFNLWQSQNRAIEKMNEKIEDITNALSMILQTEDFVNEFSRLQQENNTLREQLAKMLQMYKNNI